MARPKGSLNKKIQPVQLDFEEMKKFEIKTEVCMLNSEELENIHQEIDQARIELEKTRLEIETKKHELKSISQPAVSVVKDTSVSVKGAALNEKIASLKAYDNEMVTGKFHNLRAKGQSAKLTYMHHADDPVKWYTFNHGEIYTIPRGFADEINEHYHTPHFIKNEGIILDPSNPESGIHGVDKSDKMYSFTPINF